jgi:hypothetical protein
LTLIGVSDKITLRCQKDKAAIIPLQGMAP